ncbi:MAG: pyridoxal-phosphate dependent enzyme [Anaerolineae bacterium]|nr:pyridoxal-phosphate dependent enzyme [Anaerolineae bacterium]
MAVGHVSNATTPGWHISLEEIMAARAQITDVALRTPLVRLDVDGAPSEIWLKLEALQPTGSFKVRGAGNALRSANPAALAHGVWTASAGNMGSALAWLAHEMGIPCTVVVPHDAPPTKREAIARRGARLVEVPFATYQEIQRRSNHNEHPESIEGYERGLLIHPFADRAVMAGNGTIALEILEDLPDVDAILVPYGGGGLSCGIAAAVRAARPATRVYACEVASAAPLAASLAAGEPVQVDYTPSFVTGMGAPFVFPQMWPLASRLLDGALVVTLDQVAQAMRILATRAHVAAEGAGAVAVAAALAGRAGAGKVACVVSGGNVDVDVLVDILQGCRVTPQ